ncbi:MAG: crosslink repair DNA glycosylase YcaQ family protein [Ornithinimicrobium sp.]
MTDTICPSRQGTMVRHAYVGMSVQIGNTGVVFLADRTPAAGFGHAHNPSSESGTRDLVRRAVGARGPVTARSLADELSLTPAAVRRHLDALAEQEAIVEHEQAPLARRRGRGRPARAYVLTDQGQAQLDNSYEDIASAALAYLAQRAGDEAVADFSHAQMAGLAEQLKPAVDSVENTVEARTAALAGALSEQGFAASVRPVAADTGMAGLQLCQGHCPVQHIAANFPQLCEAETDAISELLGVHVQRLATLAGGAHVCTTYVPTAALSTGAALPEPRVAATAMSPSHVPVAQAPATRARVTRTASTPAPVTEPAMSTDERPSR